MCDFAGQLWFCSFLRGWYNIEFSSCFWVYGWWVCLRYGGWCVVLNFGCFFAVWSVGYCFRVF